MSLIYYATIYHIYKHPLVVFMRLLFFVILGVISVLNFMHGITPKGPLFFLSLFLMGEVFYHFKVLRVPPMVSITKNTSEDLYKSFTLPALDSFFFAQSTNQIIKNLISQKSIKFILHKANIDYHELMPTNLKREDLAKEASELVKDLEGIYITRMDLFIAFLLATELQTQLLFKKHLKEQDILDILYWARCDFSEEENPKPSRVLYWGEGLFDNITTGWSLETKKYTTDITYRILDEKPILIGRRKEFQEMVDILSRPTKNNALLVGETGAGKSSLVDALAINSLLGLLQGNVYHKRIYQLMTGLLVAGVQDMGELESRLEAILQELYYSGNIILFIPDLENIVGASTFHIDLSGALIPYLRGKHLPLIATTTPGAYKNFIEPVSSFADVFEVVKIEPLTRDEATQMLLEKASEIEEINRVSITYKAIIASVDLAHRYMQERALPGSAMSLLSSVAASAKGTGKLPVVDEKDVIAKMEEKTNIAIGTPGAAEKELLLHLEDELHKRIVGQNEAVNAIAQAIRRLRAGLTAQTRPISFLFLGPTGVGKTETAKALAAIYFHGEEKTIRLDMSEYTAGDSIDRLLGSEPGRGKEKGELTEKVYEHPFSLVLLDEFEKAHPEILDLFLQVFEDGRLTDNHGKTVSFANTIIIATSNAGALWVQDQLKQGRQIDAIFQRQLLAEVEKEHIFKPELLNRFDGIIIFKPLTEQEIQHIAQLEFQKIKNKLQEQDIGITFDDKLIAHLAQEGFDPEFGARPLRRFIQDKIEDVLAREMLEGEIERGSQVTVSVDDTGNITFQTTK